MRIAYLECFSGISGDMFLGALLDAGVPPEIFTRTVAALGVDARLEISRVDRSGISATKLDVIAAGEKELPREEFWEQEAQRTSGGAQSPSPGNQDSHGHSHAHSHSQERQTSADRRMSSSPSPQAGAPALHGHDSEHEHQPDHSHSHGHDHSHSHGHDHGHAHAHRGLKEIRGIIQAAALSDSAKARAIKIFAALGAAEAKVHNRDIEEIHFHEVGAIDAIVDIVCAAVGAETLGVDEWVCSPLNLGGGTVVCAHGTFPIPAPATLELLKHAPVYSGEIQKELVTPTGAAIVSVLAARFSQFPAMQAEKIAYGAGTLNFKNFPNVLRTTVCESSLVGARQESPFPLEEISVLEANV